LLTGEEVEGMIGKFGEAYAAPFRPVSTASKSTAPTPI
jgi:hypothetical protein